ncbi:hypothetical protein LCGC14_1127040 [marine sediment metagenome]|uniref:Uncharacterized protein n=1 Tax=marine sediment metagenome TaxID=412755 RepID=A0A0F9PKD1_9ZZZZ
MAASVVEICNKALLELGEESITLLTDNNKRAEKCNLVYDDIRDSLMSMHPWKFALRRVQRDLNTNSRFTLLRTDGGWTASASGTDEYYLPPSNPLSFKESPDDVFEDDTAMTAGTIGSLSAGEWGFGNNDSLAFPTIYVRLADGADPDSKFASDEDFLEGVYDDPAFQWDRAYPQPADSLRIWEIIDRSLTLIPPKWDLEGERILTNERQVNMRYTPQFTDTAKFDILYEDTLVFAIGAKLSIIIPNKRTFKSDMVTQFDVAVSQARKYNAIEANMRFEKALQSQRPSSPWQVRGHGAGRLSFIEGGSREGR